MHSISNDIKDIKVILMDYTARLDIIINKFLVYK